MKSQHSLIAADLLLSGPGALAWAETDGMTRSQYNVVGGKGKGRSGE